MYRGGGGGDLQKPVCCCPAKVVLLLLSEQLKLKHSTFISKRELSKIQNGSGLGFARAMLQKVLSASRNIVTCYLGFAIRQETKSQKQSCDTKSSRFDVFIFCDIPVYVY